jgi:phosphoribosylformylglycinamidine cyclo-ligase
MSLTYKDAGVDLSSADQSTKAIASLAKSTFTPHVLRDIGLFSGFYRLDLSEYQTPILVSSIDGVGTKLKIAFMAGVHDTIGQDLVNHCVNDIMTSTADPIFFLDYIGTQSLLPSVTEEIIKGMAIACRENNCALIGGETAEMPGFYAPGEYDLAGTIVGIVDQDRIVDGSRIQAGDVLLGLASNGLHTNGYSLARKILFEHKSVDISTRDERLGMTWGEVLLKVHKSYRQAIQSIRGHDGLVGISHITGGGILGNTVRLLSDTMSLDIRWDAWDWPVEFQLLQEYGSVSDEEMQKVFNLGIGLILVVRDHAVNEIQTLLKTVGESATIIGTITEKAK